MSPLSLSGWPAVLCSFVAAALITAYFMPFVVKVASVRNLTDKPGKRKIHQKAIPTLGGVGIFIGFSFGFLMSVRVGMGGLTFFLVSLLLLLFVGVCDDLINIRAVRKLAAEIFAGLILVIFTDIRLTNFHGFLGMHEIPLWLTYLSSIFAIVIVTNALNLIDGIDGLAASTGIIASISLSAWFLFAGDYNYAIMASSLAGTLIIFLFFNFSEGKNKVFMGDTGSLIIGFILVVMLLHFNETTIKPDKYFGKLASPAISAAILVVPLFDTLRVFTIRILRGQHPFKADKSHIHHLLLRAGYSHKSATLYISLVHIFIIWLIFSLNQMGNFFLMILLLTLGLVSTGMIFILIHVRTGQRAVNSGEYELLDKMILFAQKFRIF